MLENRERHCIYNILEEDNEKKGANREIKASERGKV